MDEIDLFLIKKLFENSHLTYRELAEITDMSVSAIHKRIKSIEEDGNINAYIARPSVIALKSLWIIIFGTSKAKSMDAVSYELGHNENIEFVAIAGGKYLYISAFLRNISELQELSSYVSTTASLEVQNWLFKYRELSKNKKVTLKSISGFYIAFADIKVEPFWVEFFHDNVKAEIIYPSILRLKQNDTGLGLENGTLELIKEYSNNFIDFIINKKNE